MFIAYVIAGADLTSVQHSTQFLCETTWADQAFWSSFFWLTHSSLSLHLPTYEDKENHVVLSGLSKGWKHSKSPNN